MGEHIVSLFAEFMINLANGKFPSEYFSFVAQSRLIPLRKDESVNPKIRPITLTDTITKIIGNLLLNHYHQEIANHLQPLQLGLNKRHGLEYIVHLSTHILQDIPDWDIFNLDSSNAFNSVSRQVALAEIQTHLPGLFPFVSSMYINPSKLWVQTDDGPRSIMSCEGVRQGDTLGPLFFAMAANVLLLKLKEKIPEGIVVAYHDDFTLAGPREKIFEALEIVLDLGPRIGLNPNPAKSKLLMACTESLEQDVNNFARLLGVDPTSETFVHHLSPMKGTLCLGTPIGSPEYISSWLSEKIAALKTDFSTTNEVNDIQSRWIFLHYIMKSKITYLQRTLHPCLLSPFQDQFSSLMRDSFERLINQRIDQPTWDRASLPIDCGGFGFGYLQDTALGAYLASCLTSFAPLSDAGLCPEQSWFINAMNQVRKYT
jgi:ubiquitin carboxyl-terminal hydrolase 44/49